MVKKYYTRVKFGNFTADFCTKIEGESLEDIRLGNCQTQEQKDNPDFWPCLYCASTGKTWDPDDYDIIEGRKLASKITCGFCGGTGVGDKDYAEFVYNKGIKQYETECKKGTAMAQGFAKALKKMSRKEAELVLNVVNSMAYKPYETHKIDKEIVL